MSDPRPAPAPPPLVTEAQRTLLYALRRRGEATVEQLADALGLTVSAVRQHLAALTDLGLAASGYAPRAAGRRGRPTRLPEADVERTTHMVAGAHSCTYEIRRR